MRFLVPLTLLLAPAQVYAQAPPPPPVLDQDGQAGVPPAQPPPLTPQPAEIPQAISTPVPPAQVAFQPSLATAQALFALHRHEAAYDHLSELYKQSPTPELRFLLAGAAQQTGRLDEAGKLLQMQADKEFGQKQIDLTRWINALAGIEVALSLLIDGKYALVMTRLTPNIDELDAYKRVFADAGIPDSVFLAVTQCLRMTKPRVPGNPLFQSGTRSYYLSATGYEGDRETAMPLIERRLGDAAQEIAVDMVGSKRGFLTAMSSNTLGNPMLRTRLQQLDATGRTDWMVQFGGGQLVRRIAAAPSGDTVVVGTYPAPRTEVWVSKVTAEHKLAFDFAVAGTLAGPDPTLALQTDGAILLGASTKDKRPAVVRLGATGAIIWTYSRVGAELGRTAAIAVAGDGAVIVETLETFPRTAEIAKLDATAGVVWQAPLRNLADISNVSGIFGSKGGFTAIGSGKMNNAIWYANVSLKGKIGKFGFLPIVGHVDDVIPCSNKLFCMIAQNTALNALPAQQLLAVDLSSGKARNLLSWPVAMQQMKRMVALKNNQIALFGDSMAPGQQARDGIFWRGTVGR